MVKTIVRVYDYADAQVPRLARMYETRLQGCRAIGYDSAASLSFDSLTKSGIACRLDFNDAPLCRHDDGLRSVVDVQSPQNDIDVPLDRSPCNIECVSDALIV
jgi:hypothetical protein